MIMNVWITAEVNCDVHTTVRGVIAPVTPCPQRFVKCTAHTTCRLRAGELARPTVTPVWQWIYFHWRHCMCTDASVASQLTTTSHRIDILVRAVIVGSRCNYCCCRSSVLSYCSFSSSSSSSSSLVVVVLVVVVITKAVVPCQTKIILKNFIINIHEAASVAANRCIRLL